MCIRDSIEAGKVGTVIVKDMSRLGRNYLQVGFYTEMLFPQKGVRFIAVNDNVDLSLIHIFDGFYEECFKTNKEIPMVMIVRLKKVKRDSLK